MKKEFGFLGKKGAVGIQLSVLMLSLFAFSFIIWNADNINAADPLRQKIALNLDSQGNVLNGLDSSVSSVNTLGGGSSNALIEAQAVGSGLASSGNTYVVKEAFTAKIGETSILVPKGTPVLPGSNGQGFVTLGDTTYTIEANAVNNFVEVQVPKGSSSFSRFMQAGGGTGADALFSGLQWAGVAYMGGQMLGSMLGMSKGNTQALSTSLAAGAGTYKSLAVMKNGAINGWAEKSIGKLPFGKWGIQNPPIVGIGIGAAVFIATYKKETTRTYEFNCLPWQAPTGGDVCESCNDENLPCSEYRCKALGQNCELVNPGSDQERCVAIRNDDVTPPIITPNRGALSEGYNYANVKASPPGPGFNIVNLGASDGCLKAFTPLTFGVDTDEPAQCKIDFKSTLTFDEMGPFMGGSNFYAYNHTEFFSLPNAKDLENSSFKLENGKDLTFFIRCRDKKGNENSAEYAVKFCIDPTPDSTAPIVEATSVTNGGCVAEDQVTANVDFYTNEPSECRWSPQDQDYDNMQGLMSCSGALYRSNAMQLFSCSAELTGVARDNTKFYIRCKDQPGKPENDRNENKESFEFSLRGSTGLKLKNLQPNETTFGGVRPSPIEIYAETSFGCNDGQAVCFYATSDDDNKYIQFFDTNTEDGIHTQRLDLDAGNHKYYVKCVDEGGNVVKDVLEFKLEIDENAPVVARVYEEDRMLKLVTVRNSECVYTNDNCDFSFEEGTVMPYANTTVHVTEWNQDKTYYVKCRDEFRNEDADCSVVVKPSIGFL